jgi:predicted nucleic acid-binding protein
MRFVLDASILLAALLGEEAMIGNALAAVQALKSSTAIVPVLWQAEVANALVVKERQKRIDETFLKRVLRQIGELPIEVDLAAARETFDRVLPLARRHKLSVYDACYLELALRERAPLASLDAALLDAARREGVASFEGSEQR